MISDILICSVRELRRNKLRSCAVLVGYIIAVTIMLVTADLLLFAKVAENETMSTTGTHFATYLPNCGDITTLSEQEIEELAKGIIPQKCKELCKNCTGCNKKPIDILNEGFIVNTNTTRLLSLDLVEKVNHLKTVKDASGYLMFRFRNPDFGRLFTVGGFQLGSIAVETNCCSPADLVDGAFLSPAMVNKVLVEQGYAINMGLLTGSKVSIAQEQFEVVGIVNSGVKPGKADIYMLFAEAERVINRRIKNPLFHEANLILIEAADPAQHNQAISEVKALMQHDSIISYGCYKLAAGILGFNERSIWVFMALIGLGAILFAVKVQWSSVIERNKNIAILKAIGWTDRVIILQILAESLLQALVGCFIGVLLSRIIVMTAPVASLLGIDAEPAWFSSPLMILIIVAFAIAGGTFAGIIPVLVSFKSRPSDILRRI